MEKAKATSGKKKKEKEKQFPGVGGKDGRKRQSTETFQDSETSLSLTAMVVPRLRAFVGPPERPARGTSPDGDGGHCVVMPLMQSCPL